MFALLTLFYPSAHDNSLLMSLTMFQSLRSRLERIQPRLPKADEYTLFLELPEAETLHNRYHNADDDRRLQGLSVHDEERPH